MSQHYMRHSIQCGDYWGDSTVNPKSNYPLEGSLKTLGGLINIINTQSDNILSLFEKPGKINYILYYNPYTKDADSQAFGLFDFFQ